MTSIAVHVKQFSSFSFILSIGEHYFLLFLENDMFIFQGFLLLALKTILIVAIAIAVAIGVVAVVFVVGGQYQQELFEEYMEDSQRPPSTRGEIGNNLPKFEMLP